MPDTHEPGATAPDIWQASSARHRFADVLDAAVAGRPQFIRRRDGKEVVLVSRDYFERTRPNLKSYLLASGFADDAPDVFDAALTEVRTTAGALVAPRATAGEARSVRPRHRRS